MRVYFDKRDWWIGVYFGPDATYVCPFPCVVFKVPKSEIGAGHD